MRAFGVDEARIAAFLGDDEESDAVDVWPENAPALDLFLCLRTQWRMGAMGGVLGLDYSGVLALFRMRRVKNQPEMLGDLQVMESAALPILTCIIHETCR
ncbi:MAG: DUF1799 domain-containing protein [Burkholderiales bacterium]|nr:DUF1799 domain-containing protein [Burkholderiales bacterium]